MVRGPLRGHIELQNVVFALGQVVYSKQRLTSHDHQHTTTGPARRGDGTVDGDREFHFHILLPGVAINALPFPQHIVLSEHNDLIIPFVIVHRSDRRLDSKGIKAGCGVVSVPETAGSQENSDTVHALCCQNSPDHPCPASYKEGSTTLGL